VLLYGARTPQDILFRRELEQWRARFDLDVHVTVDRGSQAWRGSVGVVTSLIPKAPFDPRDAVAMMCGPEVMMRYTALELQRRGVPVGQIYVSMERNMKCAVGFCGHCQFGQYFVCRDGPVFPYDRVEDLINRWEI
jgi:NAD(P)H-flavin reductase